MEASKLRFTHFQVYTTIQLLFLVVTATLMEFLEQQLVIGADPLVALGFETDVITGEIATAGQTVELVATGRKYRLAAQQKHNDIANRTDIVKTVSLAQAAKDDESRKERDLDDVPDLFPDPASHPDYRWGMSIDLDKCNGCGACTVACDLENNVPQVGREQILLGREMHWIRVDRYFGGPVNNPTVTFQPVACQHCNHAPCEGVCPGIRYHS